ncbi:MAG: DRTGG domain-containing protein [Clostridia bacterium]|nr:DRTGG domain-containing protein [Clostridia bacterium]
MTVKELVNATGFNALCLPDPEREIEGAYVGDLLSWVMGRANADNIWITIMSNLNVIAVASLSDVACVLLSENVTLDDELIKTANEKGINVLTTSLATYEAAVKISGII